jgi:hypothetical protein
LIQFLSQRSDLLLQFLTLFLRGLFLFRTLFLRSLFLLRTLQLRSDVLSRWSRRWGNRSDVGLRRGSWSRNGNPLRRKCRWR